MLANPQPGDCFLAYLPDGPKAIHVVHRRDPWIWFGGPALPIRSASVADLVATLRMADAVDMSDEPELSKWPEPEVPGV